MMRTGGRHWNIPETDGLEEGVGFVGIADVCERRLEDVGGSEEREGTNGGRGG